MTEQTCMDWLGQIHAQVKAGQNPTVSVRELLKRFDSQRRGINVVNKLRNTLAAYHLETVPDFEGEYIDNLIRFKLATEPEGAAPAVGSAVHEPLTDPAFRIGKLPAANMAPVSVKPNQQVSEAITIMLM